MVRKSLFIFTFTLLSFGLHAQKKDQGDLARVAILKFQNQTGKTSYNWASSSLPEAINKSMKVHFEYILQDPDQVQRIADEQTSQGSDQSVSKIAQVATISQSEIIIYGNFLYNDETNKIKIRANVYYAEEKKIIGQVEADSEVNQQVFEKIDFIAKKIVDVIYQFTLSLDAEEAKRKREELRLRILVLVPSFTSKAEKNKATAELELLKQNLSQKYKARFLTLGEFYRERNIPRRQKRLVNKMARKQNKPGIINWLASHGVKDAFIVFVRKNKVSITPVNRGKVETEVDYPVDATPERRQKAVALVSKKAGIREITEDKVSIRKLSESQPPPGNALRIIPQYILAVGDTKTFIKDGLGGMAGYQHNLVAGFSAHLILGLQFLEPASGLNTKTWSGNALLAGSYQLFNLGPVYFSTHAGGGLVVGKVSAGSVFFLPAATGGVLIDWFFTRRVGISLSGNALYVFDKDRPALFPQVGLGLAYRL